MSEQSVEQLAKQSTAELAEALRETDENRVHGAMSNDAVVRTVLAEALAQSRERTERKHEIQAKWGVPEDN